MRPTVPFAALLVLGVAAVTITGGHATPGGETQSAAGARALEFFDIAEMPLKLVRPELSVRKDRYILRCSAVNQSAEQLYGARLLLAAFNARHEASAPEVGWVERIEISGYGMREVTVELPARFRPPRGGRLLVAVEQTFGRESIWYAMRIENAFRAYARGESPAPEVRRVSNQFDRP